MTTSLSIGKYRALGRASDDNGVFSIVAIDHQDSLKRAINPDSPDAVTPDELTTFKLDVLELMADEVTGVLLDPVYGAAQAIAADLLNDVALLVELEKADYMLDPLPAVVEIDPNWSVHSIKHMGAEGVKLFYYDNPNDKAHAAQQDAIISRVVADCATHDIPLYAEPIFLRAHPTESKRKAVIASAQRAAALGVDVLKLEFPTDAHDTAEWMDACTELTESLPIPWVLLSAGVGFDVFAQQLEVACRAGASGFIVGRALWGEAAQLQSMERLEWLGTTGQDRITQLREIAQLHARSWHKCYAPPTVTADWFRAYDQTVRGNA